MNDSPAGPPEESSGAGARRGTSPETVEEAHVRGDTVERPAVRPFFDDLYDERYDASSTRTGRRDDRDPTGGAHDDGEHDGRYDGQYDGSDDPSYEDGSHPVAVPLAGFFTGMAYALLMPVLWFWLSDPDSIGDLVSADIFYFVPAIVVPLGLAVAPRTRRFGRYMLLGVVLSGVVVVGVAAIVLSFLIFSGG